jgi:hypothetical protein
MSFTKPYNYVDGVVLSASDQNSNDDAAKKYVNQGIVQGDYALAKIDFDQIESGELDPITSAYRFMSGEILGQASGISDIDRAYFTSHIKPDRQQSNSRQYWQTISETGQTLYLSHEADILITFGATFVCSENDIQPNGRWANFPKLRYKSKPTEEWQPIEGTLSLAFEETTAAGSGSYVPCVPTSNGISYPNSSEPQYALRRWVGWTWVVKNLPEGYYSFSVTIDTKVEQGYSSARSFTCEIFYC